MNPFTLIDVSSEKRICPIHGEYEAKKVKLSSLSKTFLILGCPLCEEERDKKLEQIDQKKVYRSYGIPEKYLDTTLDNFDTEQSANLERAKHICNRYAVSETRGRNLLLIGPSGSGKTHLATAVLKMLPGENKTYTNITLIMNEIKSTYSKSRGYLEERRESIMNRYSWVEYLVIDNIEEFKSTQDNKNILFELINNRYQNNRCTIVGACLDQKSLREAVGENLLRRIKEKGAIIELEGENARRIMPEL
jgi:DNA replication protein DnaC